MDFVWIFYFLHFICFSVFLLYDAIFCEVVGILFALKLWLFKRINLTTFKWREASEYYIYYSLLKFSISRTKYSASSHSVAYHFKSMYSTDLEF